MSIFLNDWNSIVRINGYKSIEYKRKILRKVELVASTQEKFLNIT